MNLKIKEQIKKGAVPSNQPERIDSNNPVLQPKQNNKRSEENGKNEREQKQRARIAKTN